MIAGFPTETEEMFENAATLAKNAAFPACMSFLTARVPARLPHACRNWTARL